MGGREDAALELVVSLHRILRTLRRAAPAGRLQPTQLILLALLKELGPSRIGVLADRVPCSQPTATAAIVDMQSAGLVHREPDPTDGRATRVAVTEAGTRALADVAHGEAEALMKRLGSLPPEDVESVLAIGRVLRRLAEAEVSDVEVPDADTADGDAADGDVAGRPPVSGPGA
ncbi:MarR family winged helix-turn-helix transcriptional regulator [Streptomyces daliensis]|uniref:Winged helix-turn-helix transcriptional regulator n=1 Tax=Streptomyces daliensis TaxID=299421 RepID=A0A8T4IK52_9ACTN|nr:winged helix-turn-helix transcriptional regulator [Streptomyces daliensis]